MTIKLSKIALITAALMTQGAFLSAGLTDAEELALVKSIAPYAKPTATTQVWPATADATPDGDVLDSAKFGTSTKKTNTDFYWDVDGTDLYATSFVGDVWRTFRAASLAASWNATATVTLTEITRDGAAPGGGTEYTLDLTLTKSASAPADLEQATIVTFLKKHKTNKLLTITGTGTTLAGTLQTGWTSTAVVKDNTGTAVQATLGAMEQGFTLPITLDGESIATSFTGVVKRLDQWNLATNSTVTKKIKFTSDKSHEIEFNFLPGPMARTAEVGDGILNALNTVLKDRFLAVKAASSIATLYNKGTDVSAELINSIVTTNDASVIDKAKADVGVKLGKAAVLVGDFTTTADTNNYGLAAVGKATDGDIINVTWRAEGPKVIANGQIGTGQLKDFECDLTGLLIIKDDTNNVLTFKSKDGDVFYVKSFDTTGLDTTAVTTYGNDFRDDLLAAELVTKLTATGTIDAKAADAY